MKILYLTNVPAPYRVHYFNLLAKECELTVLYEKKASDERNTHWNHPIDQSYTSIFLDGHSVDSDKAFCPGVTHYLKKNKYDYIVICGIASPTAILAIQWCKIKRIPYCMEGDGAFVKQESYLKNRLKRSMISKAYLLFCTCKEHEKYYLCHGANPKSIVKYHFSSVSDKDIIKTPVESIEKSALRKTLGITEDKMILYVGQIIHRKGVDILLNIFNSVSDECALCIVGGYLTDDYKKMMNNGIKDRIYEVGFKNKEELAKYYRAADVFVFPTREDIWGLVVNESLAFGLPVVASDRCNAALEMIRENEQGFIINDENIDSYVSCIEKCIDDAERIGQNCIDAIHEYTIEQMVADHMRVFYQNRREN